MRLSMRGQRRIVFLGLADSTFFISFHTLADIGII